MSKLHTTQKRTINSLIFCQLDARMLAEGSKKYILELGCGLIEHLLCVKFGLVCDLHFGIVFKCIMYIVLLSYSDLGRFLTYPAQCACISPVCTVYLHLLFNSTTADAADCVLCQNNYGCASQGPVQSWQHAGSYIQISAVVCTLCSCLMQYLGRLCIIMCCPQLRVTLQQPYPLLPQSYMSVLHFCMGFKMNICLC